MLFLSLLVLQVAHDTRTLQIRSAWAADVIKAVPDGISLPKTPEWTRARTKVGSMIQPIYHAHQEVVWAARGGWHL